MKIIEQVSLSFQEGNSDKVYEVDLLEVADGQYVVNFRYGRRGANLKDGSKTPLPVDYAQAKGIFDKLVGSKTKKGYQHGSATPAPVTPTTPIPEPPGSTDPRVPAILKRLTEGERSSSAWSLTRAIWRAAEIGIPEASPLLAQYLGESEMRDYCIIAAWGRCGGPIAVSELEKLFRGPATDLSSMQQRMTCLALAMAGGDAGKQKVREALATKLPAEVQSALTSGDSKVIQAALTITEDDPTSCEQLEILYLLDAPASRPALIAKLEEIALKPSGFQRVRHIFKASEYRRDAEIYGIVAHRFEKTRANYTKPEYMWSNSFYAAGPDGRYQSFTLEDRKGPNAKLAYSTQTRQYLRQRSWRTLNRLGELKHPSYVQMAVGILLPFTDGDGREPYETSRYDWTDWRNPVTISSWWDSFSQYNTFNRILHQNSTRYKLVDRAKTWQCAAGYKPGDPLPSVREEAYPELWNQQPQGLLHLLSESRCKPVHEFAARALRDNMDFAMGLDEEPLIMLLGCTYEISATLGFEIVNRKFSSGSLQLTQPLLAALFNTMIADGRRLAQTIVNRRPEEFRTSDILWAQLIQSSHEDVRSFAVSFLTTQPIPDETASAILARIVSFVMGLGPDDADLAKAIAETTARALQAKLILVGMEVVSDLIGHSVPGVQELGADILAAHRLPADQIPDEVMRTLLNSQHESIRGLGIRILSQFTDTELVQRESLLASLAVSTSADLRQSVRPLIARLAQRDGAFAQRIAQQFLETLLRARLGDELLGEVASILKVDLARNLGTIDSETVWRLLRTKSGAAHDVGGELLKSVRPEELNLRQITDLASHDVLSVREASWAMMDASVDRAKADLIGAIRFLDAEWDDSRAKAFSYFEEKFTDSDFTPDVLVAVCDSIREDVQQFGRRLLTTHFNSDDAIDYLIRLSEHPTEGMQMFVSTFVDRTIATHPEKLNELEPYFRAVLCRVNRGRIAKKRVLHLLATEASRSDERAQQVAALLGEMSATASVEMKAACLETLVKIRREHPNIPMPITIKQREVRNAV